MVQSVQGDLSNRMEGVVNELQFSRMMTTLDSIQELLRRMPEGHWDAEHDMLIHPDPIVDAFEKDLIR